MPDKSYRIILLAFTVIAIAVTAWMTRYTVEIHPRVEATFIVQDRWTGEVAYVVAWPKQSGGDHGSYGGAALFSLSEYKANRKREAQEAQLDAIEARAAQGKRASKHCLRWEKYKCSDNGLRDPLCEGNYGNRCVEWGSKKGTQ